MSDKLTDVQIQAILDEEDTVEAGPKNVREVQGALTSVTVLTDAEAAWFEDVRDRYQTEYKFENVADLQDLDRLLILELLSYRFSSFMLIGHDYDGLDFDDKGLRDHKGKIDQEIRLLKQHMGMNRKNRIESEQESVGEYLKNVLRRAEEFGIHRDKQVNKAFDLLQEILKRVGLYYRCDEEERRHLGVDADQILLWIEQVAKADFEAIDDAFRKNQKIWVKEVG